MTPKLVLSLFPGVGLLDRAFELAGFCVVRGPDLLWGGDVRGFTPPAFVFDGVIGGPPCQDFSGARRAAPTGNGEIMLAEFVRVVRAASPRWWLMENVDAVPDVRIDGWSWQRVPVEAAWYGPVRRLRHVQFGARGGAVLSVPRGVTDQAAAPCVLANDDRPFRELCRMQGLGDEFALPGFTVEEAKRAVGNGVPFCIGRVLAAAVLQAVYVESSGAIEAVRWSERRCACTCGAAVTGAALYASASCRKRAQRRRDRSCDVRVGAGRLFAADRARPGAEAVTVPAVLA